MKKKILLLMGVFPIGIINAQIGINTETPNASLDVVAINSPTHIAGIQAPRLTLNELTLKGSSIYGADQIGCIIFISDISSGNNSAPRTKITSIGYYYFDGSLWEPMGQPSTVPNIEPLIVGDVKYSFGTADHDGWYLLNGRTISTLPSSVQSAATGLGFAANLPNTLDRSLKSKTGSEALGSTGGVNSLTITQANLPNITTSGTISGTSGSGGAAHTHIFSGTAASGGTAHTHTFTGTSDNGGGAHTHTFTGASASGGGAHTHTYSGTSSNAGAHTHTFTGPPGANTNHRGNPPASVISIDSRQTRSTSNGGAHTHTFSGTSSSSTHTHTFSGASTNNAHTHSFTSTSANSTHTHTFSGASVSAGAHTHTFTGSASVPLGGSGLALDNRSPFLTVNTFVYLGK